MTAYVRALSARRRPTGPVCVRVMLPAAPRAFVDLDKAFIADILPRLDTAVYVFTYGYAARTCASRRESTRLAPEMGAFTSARGRLARPGEGPQGLHLDGIQ